MHVITDHQDIESSVQYVVTFSVGDEFQSFSDLRRVHTGHPMRIEPDQIRFERVHTECAFAQSGSDPD